MCGPHFAAEISLSLVSMLSVRKKCRRVSLGVPALMQKMAAQKIRDRLMDVAEKQKLLVQAGFPFVTRDYRMGLPRGTLELMPDPAGIPRELWVSTEFECTFFPEIGAPVNVGDWADERWADYLRGRIAELQKLKG